MIEIEPPLIPTPEAIVQLYIERLQATYPNFNPNPASPEYRQALAFANIAAEVILLAFNVPDAIIAEVGKVVYGIPPNPATPATTSSTWEARDSKGHQIPAGTIVLLTPEGGEPVAFEVTETVEIAEGETKTTPGAVKLQAVNAGSEGNMTGAVAVAPNEQLAWVEAITLTGAPDGGVEEESITEYKRRLLELAKLVKPQPILPQDFADFVRLMVPGVERCLAIDLLELKANYSNEVGAEGVERCVTVVPLTAAGVSPTKAALEEAMAKLVAAREESFKPFVGLPTVHAITIKVVGDYFKGYTAAGVKAEIEVALNEFLNPAKWGVPSSGDKRSWVNKTVLRYQDVVTVLNNVPGFNFYTELKVNGGAADVNLTGIAPLVEPGAFTITLTEGPE